VNATTITALATGIAGILGAIAAIIKATKASGQAANAEKDSTSALVAVKSHIVNVPHDTEGK
jgi:hypothetical protein